MSGTPGHVSLRSVCDRLFHRPMRATRHWNGTKSSRNRFLALGFSNVLTNDETAVSYSVFRLIQLMSGRPGQRVIFRLLALSQPAFAGPRKHCFCFPSRADSARDQRAYAPVAARLDLG